MIAEPPIEHEDTRPRPAVAVADAGGRTVATAESEGEPEFLNAWFDRFLALRAAARSRPTQSRAAPVEVASRKPPAEALANRPPNLLLRPPSRRPAAQRQPKPFGEETASGPTTTPEPPRRPPRSGHRALAESPPDVRRMQPSTLEYCCTRQGSIRRRARRSPYRTAGNRKSTARDRSAADRTCRARGTDRQPKQPPVSGKSSAWRARARRRRQPPPRQSESEQWKPLRRAVQPSLRPPRRRISGRAAEHAAPYRAAPRASAQARPPAPPL